MDDRGVKTSGECHRRDIRDLILHRGHSADPAPDQGRGGAGKQVTYARRATGAGVQNDQARHRPSLPQQVDQPVRRHQVSAPVRAHQRQHALVLGVIKVSVSDEVQHVPLAIEQHVLQVGPGRARSPVHLGQFVGTAEHVLIDSLVDPASALAGAEPELALPRRSEKQAAPVETPATEDASHLQAVDRPEGVFGVDADLIFGLAHHDRLRAGHPRRASRIPRCLLLEQGIPRPLDVCGERCCRPVSLAG